MTEQHHPGRLETLPRRARASRDLGEQPARCGERLARDRIEILEPDRNPAERRRAGLREARVGTVGGRERILLVDAHPRIDRAWIPVVAVFPVALPNAPEARLGELPRGDLSPREQPDRLDNAGVSRFDHAAG